MKIDNSQKRWYKALRPVLVEVIKKELEAVIDQNDAFGGQASAYGAQVTREFFGRREMLRELPGLLDAAFEYKRQEDQNQ